MILDTSKLIDFFRRKDKENSQLFKLSENDLAISVITYFEFDRGFNTSTSHSGKSILNQFKLLDFDKNCAEQASKIYQHLKSENKLIDLADLLIAATALAHQMPLATLNKKDFDRIPDLILV